MIQKRMNPEQEQFDRNPEQEQFDRNPEQEYFDMNRRAWNLKTEVHLRSDFYRHDAFLKGASSLNPIECHLLGDLDQRSVLHLQCHFGQDTLSLERLGAQVTGVDLSDSAIDTARATATDLGSSAEFICCNLYDLPQHLNRTFDLVFTSYGTIGWLPDLKRWAAVVSHFLKLGGRFIMVDFHPVVWMFDNQFGSVAYRYFNSGPIIETEQGTYADPSADLVQTSVTWNHSLSELMGSLLQHGLHIQSFDEFDYSPYPCFQHAVEVAPGKYRIKHLGDQIPMVYALTASK